MALPFDPGAHPALAELGERLRELAGDAAYKAGRDYLKKGLVRQGAVAGTTAFATVSGSTDYRVSIAFGAEAKVTCTCPAHRRSRHCKHVVAVASALLEQPGAFALTEPAPAAEKAPPKKRAGAKQEDSWALRTEGLATLDSLLEELAAGGLMTLGPEKLTLLQSTGELVRALKLRRLGNLVLRLQRAAESGRGLEPTEFARLLADLWLTRAAAGAHLEGTVEMDPALAEELLGKTWREQDLERVGVLQLVEVAATRENDGEFLIETGYLVDVATGRLYTEKLITPLRLGGGGRPTYRHLILAEEAGLYPGPAPRRLKLLKARRAPLRREHLDRLVEGAVSQVAALRRLVVERQEQPFSPAELPVLFRPAAVVAQGALAGALDGAGAFLALDLPTEKWVPPPDPFALCGLLTEQDGNLRLRVLSAVSPDLGGR